MQVLEVDQIKAWDSYTIQNEPIASIDLMERAALACFRWLMEGPYKNSTFNIYCGKGNNGGDGLAIARLLTLSNIPVSVFILEFGNIGSDDFQTNLSRLHDTSCPIHFISTEELIRPISPGVVIIDALYGSGLNKPLAGLSAVLAQHINQSGNIVISVDIPSGMYADKNSTGNVIVRADYTLSFQCYKLAFLVAENEPWLGIVNILDIGLANGYLETMQPRFQLLEPPLLRHFFRRRKRFAHKGHFGHAGLIAGSFGMMGAAVLAARACLRSGAGKLTCHVPAVGYLIMQTSVPEAMVTVDARDNDISRPPSLEHYDAIAIGPGIGRNYKDPSLLSECFIRFARPVILDADALYLLSVYPDLLSQIPAGSILTPHVREFDRLFGESPNDIARINLAIEKANALQLIIVLKGHHSFIAIPGGPHYFNTSGNAGMAKGGSGDVLTGVLLALLAQGYAPREAAMLGVYLHGRAADHAVLETSMEALLPSDTIVHIGKAFEDLY